MVLDELKFVYQPALFLLAIQNLIQRIKNKPDYTKPNTNTVASQKTPGNILFTQQVFKVEDADINLQVVDKLLTNPYLLESELIYFRFYRELLNTASESYKAVSNIERIYTQNIIHLQQEIGKLEGLGHRVKLAIYIPIDMYRKSNFWCTLYFINLCSVFRVRIDYGIRNINDFINTSPLYQPSPDVYIPKGNERTIIIVCDDVSYSGQQLTHTITTHSTPNSEKFLFFLNLFAYSENAHSRISRSIHRFPKLIFGNGAITPLPKVSIRFNDPPQMNDFLYKKAFDNGMNNGLCSLLMNDMFYIDEKENNLVLRSSLLENLKYLDYSNTRDSNGSLQYLPFKYPDSLSTVDNMCSLNRQENIIIFRINRLIRFMTDEMSDQEKFNKLARIFLTNNLLRFSRTMLIYLIKNFNRLINDRSLLNEVLKNNGILIDDSLITEYIPKLMQILNNTTTKYYNNLQLFKFIKANNKIHRFNKKHLIELIGPKNNYQKFNNHQFTIRNCTHLSPVEDIDAKMTALMPHTLFCNQNCTRNTFYLNINWE